MKKLLLSLAVAAMSVANSGTAAESPPPQPKDPSLEQRLADLEAYVNNVGRAADNPTNNV